MNPEFPQVDIRGIAFSCLLLECSACQLLSRLTFRMSSTEDVLVLLRMVR